MSLNLHAPKSTHKCKFRKDSFPVCTQTHTATTCLNKSKYSSFSSSQHDHSALLWSIFSAATMYRHQRHTRCHHDHKSLPCECAPPPPPLQLSFSSSLFLFPLFSTPYRTELVYISIREQGLELARGRVCVQADSSPHCPTPAHLKWKQQHSAVWSPVSQKPCGPLCKSVCLWWTRKGGGNMSRFVCFPLCPPLQFFHFIFSLSHIHTHTSKDTAIFSLSLLFTFPHGMPWHFYSSFFSLRPNNLSTSTALRWEIVT